MNSKLKINFCWDWTPEFWQSYTWSDGLAAALRELERRGHQVRAYADTPVMIPNPMVTIHPLEDMDGDWCDVFLHWADLTRPHAVEHMRYNKPMALCFAGGETSTEQTELFDHIFVESQVYLNKFKDMGISTSIAFGTNTDLYKPIEQVKMFDALFPATFAAWKRHDLFAQATRGMKACAVGYMYESHEKECWQVCVDAGNLVLPHVAPSVLHRLYAASKTVVIPSRSDGGSQRTVLEALAMNIPCIVTDSDKFDYEGVVVAEPEADHIRTIIQMVKDEDRNTREHILKKWSHIRYADALEEGLFMVTI